MASRFEPNGGSQGFDFAGSQRPMLAGLEIAQQQRSDPHALQALDRAAERSQHAPNLALTPFEQHDSEQAASGTWTHEICSHGAGEAIVQHDAFAELIELLLAEVSTRYLGVVLLFDAEARVGQPKGQLPVVGHQHETF
jgi:hypothetical protein